MGRSHDGPTLYMRPHKSFCCPDWLPLLGTWKLEHEFSLDWRKHQCFMAVLHHKPHHFSANWAESTEHRINRLQDSTQKLPSQKQKETRKKTSAVFVRESTCHGDLSVRCLCSKHARCIVLVSVSELTSHRVATSHLIVRAVQVLCGSCRLVPVKPCLQSVPQ